METEIEHEIHDIKLTARLERLVNTIEQKSFQRLLFTGFGTTAVVSIVFVSLVMTRQPQASQSPIVNPVDLPTLIKEINAIKTIDTEEKAYYQTVLAELKDQVKQAKQSEQEAMSLVEKARVEYLALKEKKNKVVYKTKAKQCKTRHHHKTLAKTNCPTGFTEKYPGICHNKHSGKIRIL